GPGEGLSVIGHGGVRLTEVGDEGNRDVGEALARLPRDRAVRAPGRPGDRADGGGDGPEGGGSAGQGPAPPFQRGSLLILPMDPLWRGRAPRGDSPTRITLCGR